MMIFFAVALAHFIALISPGPDFLLIIKSTLRNSRRVAFGVVSGIATANALYIVLCLAGAGAILAQSVTLMILIKLFGGVFLLFIAWQALRARKSDYRFLMAQAAEDKNTHPQSTFTKEFLIGLSSGLLNPKNLLFYLSLFTVVLESQDNSALFKTGIALWMVMAVLIWDSLIMYLLTRPAVRQQFNRCAFWIDKTAGIILGMVGLKIIHMTFKSTP
ncbi:TPA: LysE family transporter [Morganella morganii]|nr:LysE family transporter [Morganella morganii]